MEYLYLSGGPGSVQSLGLTGLPSFKETRTTKNEQGAGKMAPATLAGETYTMVPEDQMTSSDLQGQPAHM